MMSINTQWINLIFSSSFFFTEHIRGVCWKGFPTFPTFIRKTAGLGARQVINKFSNKITFY